MFRLDIDSGRTLAQEAKIIIGEGPNAHLMLPVKTGQYNRLKRGPIESGQPLSAVAIARAMSSSGKRQLSAVRFDHLATVSVV